MLSDMIFYLVTQEGRRRGTTAGLYSTLEAALLRAEEAIRAEPDDYHEYYVSAIELDRPAKETLLWCVTRFSNTDKLRWWTPDPQ